jgi:hypothetical protein
MILRAGLTIIVVVVRPVLADRAAAGPMGTALGVVGATHLSGCCMCSLWNLRAE